MNIKIKTTLIILITFIIGMVAGAMIGRVYLQHRMKKILSMRAPHGLIAHFERIIEPSEEQREAVRKILQKYGKKMFETSQKIRKEMRPIQKAMQEELDAILTPEQKKRLKKRFFMPRPGKYPPPFPGWRKPPKPPGKEVET
jgi:uncharacterized membrane protein